MLGNNISFTSIRNIAIDEIMLLPPHEQDRLYEDLVHGTSVINDEPHLNKYLYSFGLMHKAKLDEAFSKIPQIHNLFSEEIEIYDWGCGQGVATICLLDYLRSYRIAHCIKRINLIDPSEAAISRTKEILSCYNECDGVEVRTVVKTFDELVPVEIISYNCRKLHLFSNILDVASFDLPQFTQLFQITQAGGNYIVSIGPLNANYKRADWFIAALNPKYKYVNLDIPKGCWINGRDWTISLRIVATFIDNVDNSEIIKKRITEAQKTRQYFAGYVLDAVSDTLANSEYSQIAEELMSSLSMFDVSSDKPLEIVEEMNPILAVMSNIISRGMPTKAPLSVEKLMASSFDYSVAPSEESITEKGYHYAKTIMCNAQDFIQALHIIDPRFKTDNYNNKILESTFESDFIHSYLPRKGKEYMIQVLEPQRSLSSIIDNIPNNRFKQDRRVDFAFEIPYITENNENHVGFVVEINGAQYHSSTTSRVRDARREAMIVERGWNVNSLSSLNDESLIESWETNNKFSSYLGIIKNNYEKTLEGEWLNKLQLVLSPFAVARLEKLLVEAMIAGHLDLSSKSWNIAVIERDVPCARMAIDDIKEMYDNLCKLTGSNKILPVINLTVVSSSEFSKSPLHNSEKTKLNQQDSRNYDLCIDISMLLRDKIATLPITIQAKTYYIIRSSHYSHEIRTLYSAENIEYLPLVKDKYEPIKEREEILIYFLQNIFRKEKFREGQLAILSRALSYKTTIGLLPTGGGKSLTYQLAGMLQPGVTIIVDPLVSLMVDQHEGLLQNRIDATGCINSTMTIDEKSYCLGRLQRGELQFMFLSPERFMMDNFREEILAMPRNNKVCFAYGVIDEVHTVSEWGHDFRPAYLQLGRNMARFMKTKSDKTISLIGLTATASYDVLADVERELTLGSQIALDDDAIVRPEISERGELTYRILEVKADFTPFIKDRKPYIVNATPFALKNYVANTKRNFLGGLLESIPDNIRIINNSTEGKDHIDGYDPENFYEADEAGQYHNAGIIFCPYRLGNFGVMDKITEYNITSGIASLVERLDPSYIVGSFIGGNNPNSMKPFLENRQNIMVATKAFGMGIDKDNVRFTINLTHPSSIESYVQEAGRSGRDKKVAIAYLLYEPTELVDFSVENLSDIFGESIPYPWLKECEDKYVEWGSLEGLCGINEMPTDKKQQLINLLSPYRINVDNNIQLYFHNNSFKGSYKERVILTDLAYGIMNVDNNNVGVIAAMNGLETEEYTYVEVDGENEYMRNFQAYRNLIITVANRIAENKHWKSVPLTAFNNGELDYKIIPTFGDLLKKISEVTDDPNWRINHKKDFLSDLEKAYCQRRDNEDTDKAIYRMCCIGLVDDVKIQYLDNDRHRYTLMVKKLPDGGYYDCLHSYFRKYYSQTYSYQLIEEARAYGKETEINNCLGYLTQFVYDKLEDKRRRAINDMREACREGISKGDASLKEFIHLYFNSKYARRDYTVNGKSYSLSKDIQQPSIELVMKYINVVGVDPSGPTINNVKHLQGAVLIILRDQLPSELGKIVLYLLRAFCIAFLGVGNNTSLLDDFKTSYWDEGLEKLISLYDGKEPAYIRKYITTVQ